MKKNFYQIAFLLMWMILLCTNSAFAQRPDPEFPHWPPGNTAFDVIIKKNGELVYGLVKEVGETLIKYKRTDIPDGPIYSIPKQEVYAISYRNQVKDILSPTIQFPFINKDSLLQVPVVIPVTNKPHKVYSLFDQSSILGGIGFIRSYSKVDNANDYSSKTTLPVLMLAYEVQKNDQLNFGLLAAIGSYKFSKQEYSSYDSAFNNIIRKENIFTLYVYGKYHFMDSHNALRPYVQGGLGIRSSYVRSENTLSFLTTPNQTIIINSGARSVGLGVMLRAGITYRLNEQFKLFTDAGIGPSILHFGVIYRVSGN